MAACRAAKIQNISGTTLVNMEADKSSLLLLLAFYQCMLGAAGYNVPALCYINLKHERSGIKEIRSSSQIQL